MPSRPISRRLDTVLRDAFDLSRRDQLALFEELRVYLGEEIGLDDPRDLRIEALRLVVDCLEKAAVFHGIDLATTTITARRYTEAKKALDLPLSQTQIIGICGRWLAAIAIARGHWVPENARQKTQRSKLRPRYRVDKDYLADVRAYLATNPHSTSRELYRVWARQERQKGTRRYDPDIITRQLGRPWSEVIIFAPSGELPPLDLEALPKFISMTTAAGILGLTQPDLFRDPRYPKPVLRGGHSDLYLTEDVIACSEGRPVPHRDAFASQAEYLLAPELAKRLGITIGSIQPLLAKKHHSVPEPSVRVPGVAALWLRSDVDLFLRERKRRKAAPKTKKRQDKTR
jgi:hypothetical protein